MKSLFDSTDNNAIINRINQLTMSNAAVWGKMTAAQMLAHVSVPMQVGFGEVKLKRGLMGILFGSMAKKQMVNERPFKQGLPTDKNFIIKDLVNFEEEKNKAMSLVKRFAEKGPSAITGEPHPFFGKLTTREWDMLTWKHLDHHLRQFGV
jgi:hypothetical protein